MLGETPLTDFHIYSRKCLLVLGYYIGITQLLLISQPETPISEPQLYIAVIGTCNILKLEDISSNICDHLWAGRGLAKHDPEEPKLEWFTT